MSLPAALTPSELAALQVPGLPNTQRGINKRIGDHGWILLPFEGPRGQRLIDVHALPEQLRAAIAARMNERMRAVAPVANDRSHVSRRRGRPHGTCFFAKHPETAEAVQGIISQYPHTATAVMAHLRVGGYPLPSIHALRRYMHKYQRRQAAVLAALRDPDTYKSKYRLALGRADGGVSYAHEVWELDTTKADVMTVGGRVMILGVIDRWSRRVKFFVAPSESNLSVRNLLIATMQAWGVTPNAVVTDNGSGYVNASVTSALDLLKIEHIICPPGSPERKPFVERVFGTFTRARAPMLQGFTGHNVAEAQRLRAAAKKRTGRAEILAHHTPEELQQILDAWVDGAYHQTPHASLGMSPMQKWLSTPQRVRPAPDGLTLALAMTQLVGTMIVGKRGIQWKRGRYWSAELAAWMGQPVMVRWDERDYGELHIFDGDGAFICTAVNAERAGLSQERFAEEAKRHQDEHMRAAKAQLRAAQRAVNLTELNQRVLRDDAERAGKLAVLAPRPRQDVPPALPGEAAAPSILPPLAQITPAPASAESIAERAARAEQLIADAEAGHDVDPQKLAWARSFVVGPAYASHRLGTATGTVISMPANWMRRS